MSAMMQMKNVSTVRPVSRKTSVRVQAQASNMGAKVRSAMAATLLAGSLLGSQVSNASALENVLAGAQDAARNAGQATLNAANKATSSNPLEKAANAVGDAVNTSNPLQRASFAVSSNADKAANKVSSAVSGNPLERAANAVSDAVSGNPVEQAANKVSNAAKKVLPDTNAFSGNSLKQAANTVSNKLDNAANSASNKLASTNAFSGNSLQQAANSVGNKLDNAASSASNKLASTNAFSGNSLKQASNTVSNKLDSAQSSASSNAKSAGNAVLNVANKPADARPTIADSAAKAGIKLPGADEAAKAGAKKNADEKAGGGFLSFLNNETADNTGKKAQFKNEVLNSSTIKQVKPVV